jgi:hypothetical protein
MSHLDKLIEHLDNARDADEQWAPANVRDSLKDDAGITVSMEIIRDYMAGDIDRDDLEEDEDRPWMFRRVAVTAKDK